MVGSKNIIIIIRKIDKNEYFTGKEILPSDKNGMTEQAMFTYSSLGKAFEKQIEDQGRKQTEG